MERTTKIPCPHCGKEVDVEKALGQKFQQELHSKTAEIEAGIKKREELLVQKEQSLKEQRETAEQQIAAKVAEQTKAEVAKREKEIKEQAAKEAKADTDAELTSWKERAQSAEKEKKELKNAQIEAEQLRSQLDSLKDDLQLKFEKDKNEALAAERKKAAEQRQAEEERIRKEIEENTKQSLQKEREEFEKKLREKDKQLHDTQKAAEDAARKAEQKSQQLQGEVQELMIKEYLEDAYRHSGDRIEDVPKGVNGADVVHYVRNKFGKEIGMILYESKRTQNFGADWIEKLKSDALLVNKEGLPVILIIVTQTMPKELEHFGQKDGVWICPWSEFKPLVPVLRDCLLRISDAYASQENKGEKKEMLYHYLTSSEFAQQIGAVLEGFVSFKTMLEKEKNDFEKSWMKKQKLLDKILSNANHFVGSVQGIAGSVIPRLESPENELLALDNG